MGVVFFIRKKTGRCSIYAKIRRMRSGIDITVRTLLYIDGQAWVRGHKDIAALNRLRAKESGTFEMLDKIERSINYLLECGGASEGTIKEAIRDRIYRVVYAEEIAEETELERERLERMVDLNTYIQRYIDGMRSGERKTVSGMLYTDGTIKNRVSFQSELGKFQEITKRRYGFDDITMDFYNDFVDYFNGKDYSPNTIGKHIKSLKVILSAAMEEGLHGNTQWQKFRAPATEADTVYLTRGEITSIEKMKLSGELALCRDVFLVGVYTAQRYSDYHRITKENVVKLENGVRAVRLIQRKTGAKVVIPLVGKLDTLLAKYGYTLPKTYSQLVNESIKVVCRRAGITQKVEHTRARGARVVTELVEKYRLVSTHTARRTGATLMYLEGVDALSVMRITGHRTEKEFRKYIRVGEEENALMVSGSRFFTGNDM